MRKLKSFLLGAVFALLVLEAALRVFGYFQTLPLHSVTEGNPRILTLGNSHTFGSGTMRNLSYPAQLERLLREGRFQDALVINPARPNITTSTILDELPGLLRKYRPDYAFVMAGEPNRWNLTGYGDYLRRKGQESSQENKWHEFIDQIRIMKLVGLLKNDTPVSLTTGKVMNGEEKLFLWLPDLLIDLAQPVGISPEKLNEAIGEWQNYLSQNKNDEKEAFLAWLFSEQGNLKESLAHTGRSLRDGKFYYLSWFALKKFQGLPGVNAMKKRLQSALPPGLPVKCYEDWFFTEKLPEKFNELSFYRNAFSIYPYHAHTYFNLIESLLKKKKYVEAASVVRQEIETNPFPNNGDHFSIFAYILRETKNPQEKNEVSAIIDRAGKEFVRRFPDESFRTSPRLFVDERSEWVRADLMEMVKLLRDNGVQVVFQNYPPQRWGKPNYTNRDIEFVAKIMHVPLLDTHKAVAGVYQHGKREDYYATQLGPNENHLNEKGYAIVAKQMYDYLLPFISPKTPSR